MAHLARNPTQIGNIIRRIRKQKGWSQSDLGKKAGVRQETVSVIENGSPTAKLETILALLAALDLEFQVSEKETVFAEHERFFK